MYNIRDLANVLGVAHKTAQHYVVYWQRQTGKTTPRDDMGYHCWRSYDQLIRFANTLRSEMVIPRR